MKKNEKQKNWKDLFVWSHPVTILFGAPIALGSIISSVLYGVTKNVGKGVKHTHEFFEEVIEDDGWI